MLRISWLEMSLAEGRRRKICLCHFEHALLWITTWLKGEEAQLLRTVTESSSVPKPETRRMHFWDHWDLFPFRIPFLFNAETRETCGVSGAKIQSREGEFAQWGNYREAKRGCARCRYPRGYKYSPTSFFCGWISPWNDYCRFSI